MSGGGGGEEGTAKMCTGVRQESTPTGRGSMSLRQHGGKGGKQTPEGKRMKKKRKQKMQFVSHKSPIRALRRSNGGLQ